MLQFTEKLEQPAGNADYSVILPWEKRIKSRLRVTLSCGLEAGIVLPRGSILRGGDTLISTSGKRAVVDSEKEKVSIVRISNPVSLAKLCYHLGNRHVALEIGDDYVKYLHDHVLDEMILGLGGTVSSELASFEPEHGAYHSHAGNQHSGSGNSQSNHPHSHG